jgi:hypothetical protein
MSGRSSLEGSEFPGLQVLSSEWTKSPSRLSVSHRASNVRQLTPLAIAIATNLPAVTRRILDGSPLALNSSICRYGCRGPARLCRSDRVHNQEEVRVVRYTDSWLTQVYHSEILRGFLETFVQFCA